MGLKVVLVIVLSFLSLGSLGQALPTCQTGYVCNLCNQVICPTCGACGVTVEPRCSCGCGCITIAPTAPTTKAPTRIPTGIAGNALPGLILTIGDAGVSQIVNKMVPPLIHAIQGTRIDQVKYGFPVKFTFSDMKITKATIGAVPVRFRNQIYVSLETLKLHIRIIFAYVTLIPKPDAGVGVVDIDCPNIQATVGIRPYVINETGRMGIQSSGTTFDLNKLSIVINGPSPSYYIVDLLLLALNSFIKGIINKLVLKTINNAVNQMGDHFVKGIKWQIPIDQNADLRFLPSGEPFYPPPSFLSVPSVGTFGDPKSGYYPPIAHHRIGDYRSGRMIDIAIDQYLFESGIYIYHKAGLFAWTIGKFPPSSPAPLNTSYFKILFPAFYQAYPDKAMQIFLVAKQRPVLNISATAQRLAAPLEATVLVNTGTVFEKFTPIFSVLLDNNVGVKINLTNQTQLIVNLDTTTFVISKFLNTTIGTFDPTLFNILFNSALVPGLFHNIFSSCFRKITKKSNLSLSELGCNSGSKPFIEHHSN